MLQGSSLYFLSSTELLPPWQNNQAPPPLLYYLESKGTASPWPCSGHGGHALSDSVMAVFLSQYSSVGQRHAQVCSHECV
jgi:hypothetical protein